MLTWKDFYTSPKRQEIHTHTHHKLAQCTGGDLSWPQHPSWHRPDLCCVCVCVYVWLVGHAQGGLSLHSPLAANNRRREGWACLAWLGGRKRGGGWRVAGGHVCVLCVCVCVCLSLPPGVAWSIKFTLRINDLQTIYKQVSVCPWVAVKVQHLKKEHTQSQSEPIRIWHTEESIIFTIWCIFLYYFFFFFKKMLRRQTCFYMF